MEDKMSVNLKKFKVGDRVKYLRQSITNNIKRGSKGTIIKMCTVVAGCMLIKFDSGAGPYHIYSNGIELLPKKNEQLLFSFMKEDYDS